MIADWRRFQVHKSLFLKAILLNVLIAGCAQQNAKPTFDTLDFTAVGKIGVRAAERGYSARFRWQQQGQRYAVEVWGPLGQGRTLLEGNPQLMTVSRGDKVLAQGDPVQVMQTHLGWSVPVGILPAWLQGAAADQLSVQAPQTDEQGRLVGFEQAGWQVSFSRFREFAQKISPAKIIAARGEQKVTVALQSVAAGWQ